MPEIPAANGRSEELGDLADHGRFVRNLAWRLLHDEDAAEEVVQETMLAAVKASPSRDRSLRPWLATVARNVIRRRFRGDSRRRKREEAAAKPEALPGTADMAARAEMLKEVVDAVLGLDEPNRSTVLLRYYEDLPPREIAVRQGVGVETVRGRLKRAVVQLRRRLDARHPEGRAGWVPMLAGLCGMDVSASILGGSTGATAGTEAAASAQAPGAVAGSFKGVAAAFLVGAAVTTSATWWGLDPSGPDAQEDAATRTTVAASTANGLRRPASPDLDAPTLAGRPEAAERHARAARRNAELRALVVLLEGKIAALQPPPPDPHAFHFALPEATPAFDAADWKDLASHLLELSKILATLREEVVTLHEPRPKTQQDALEHNQPLSLFAISILEEMGEGDPSVAYTHPSVLANLIRAALDLAGQPLSHAQEVAIRTLGEAWEAESAEFEQVVPAEAPVLARKIAEVDAKLRFVRAVKDLLTDAQRSVLFHPDTEGRMQVDLLSAALVHNAVRSPADADDRAELEVGLISGLLSLAGLEDEDPKPYAWIGKRWVDEIPDVLTPRLPWDEDLVFAPIDRIQAQARAQVRAIEGIVGTGLLDEAQAAALLRVEILLRPRIRCCLPGPDVPEGD